MLNGLWFELHFLCSSIPCPLSSDFTTSARATSALLALEMQDFDSFYYSSPVANHLTEHAERLFIKYIDPVKDDWATKSLTFGTAHEEYTAALLEHVQSMASGTWTKNDKKIVDLLVEKLYVLQKFRPLQRDGYLPYWLHEYFLLCPSVCKLIMSTFLTYQSPIRLVSQK